MERIIYDMVADRGVLVVAQYLLMAPLVITAALAGWRVVAKVRREGSVW